MVEKRFQVFVSSTYLDLIEERREVITALLELDCIPSGMELFPAANEDQWSYIKRVIDDADYYIVIVGARYGSTDSKGLSFTEKEFDYAVSIDKPILAFVHSDPDNIPRKKTERDPELDAKLEAFKDKVQKRLCKGWTSAKELGGLVSRSLIQLQKSSPAEGWVRGRYASNPERILTLESQIRQLTDENQKLKIAPPTSTQDLASGSDKFTVRYKTSQGLSDKQSWIQYSWDQLIGLLGPMMYIRASEGSLERALEQAIAEAKGIRIYSVDLVPENFHTIITQFRALGLIEKSIHKTVAKNPGVYWALTPYGENYVMKLKAVKK